jgi:proline iminopeptidase
VTPQPIPPPRASGFTTSTPHPLYWARWGAEGAPQLLVLHGGPGAHHDYLLPQMLALADQFDMVFYDQRGGGKSRTDSPEAITWQTQVEDLALVTAELISGPLTLIGYSWGGLLAMLHATSRPKSQVSRLALIAPASVTHEHRKAFTAEFARRQDSEWVRTERAALAASGLREHDPDAYRQRSFELSVAGYFAHPENARDLTPFRVTSRTQQSVWESLGDFDLRPSLRELHLPTLVVQGRQDPIPLASGQDIATALGAGLVVLDDCGHVPYVESPTGLFAALRPFLSAPAPLASE